MNSKDTFQRSQRLIDIALKKGASEVEVFCLNRVGLNAKTRMCKKEGVESSHTVDVGLRVFCDFSCASVSANSFDDAENMVDSALNIAKSLPKDEFCALESAKGDLPEILDDDYSVPKIENLYLMADETESSSLENNKIVNSEGANASWSLTDCFLSTSKGVRGAYRKQFFSLSVMPIAKDGDSMEYAYDFSNATDFSRLTSPRQLGVNAAEKAVAKLHSRKISSATMPVMFDKRVASGILQDFLKVINASAIASSSSFLLNSLGRRIMPKGLNITDDQTMEHGLRSRPFDADGMLTEKMFLVEDGVLKNWLLDSYYAKKLGHPFKSNAHASRVVGTAICPPVAGNVFISSGSSSTKELIGSISDGFYVTEILGFGANPITGNYSCGACGFKIDGGNLSFPVNEVTIAGNLLNMFDGMQVGDDLSFDTGVDSPAVLFDHMTVAGK